MKAIDNKELILALEELEKEKGIKKCYYGHLHGGAAKYAFDDNFDGIDFKLISADRLKFVPLLIKKF